MCASGPSHSPGDESPDLNELTLQNGQKLVVGTAEAQLVVGFADAGDKGGVGMPNKVWSWDVLEAGVRQERVVVGALISSESCPCPLPKTCNLEISGELRDG